MSLTKEEIKERCDLVVAALGVTKSHWKFDSWEEESSPEDFQAYYAYCGPEADRCAQIVFLGSLQEDGHILIDTVSIEDD